MQRVSQLKTQPIVGMLRNRFHQKLRLRNISSVVKFSSHTQTAKRLRIEQSWCSKRSILMFTSCTLKRDERRIYTTSSESAGSEKAENDRISLMTHFWERYLNKNPQIALEEKEVRQILAIGVSHNALSKTSEKRSAISLWLKIIAGGGRTTYTEETRPDWWPSELEYKPVKKYKQSEIETILKAVHPVLIKCLENGLPEVIDTNKLPEQVVKQFNMLNITDTKPETSPLLASEEVNLPKNSPPASQSLDIPDLNKTDAAQLQQSIPTPKIDLNTITSNKRLTTDNLSQSSERPVVVVDTCSLLQNDILQKLMSFSNTDVVICFAVFKELSRLRQRFFNARDRIQEKTVEEVQLQIMSGVANIFIERSQCAPSSQVDGIDLTYNDNAILGTALRIKEKFPERRIILLTNDRELNMKSVFFDLDVVNNKRILEMLIEKKKEFYSQGISQVNNNADEDHIERLYNGTSHCTLCDVTLANDEVSTHLNTVSHAVKLREFHDIEDHMERQDETAINSEDQFGIIHLTGGKGFCTVCNLSLHSKQIMSKHVYSLEHYDNVKRKMTESTVADAIKPDSCSISDVMFDNPGASATSDPVTNDNQLSNDLKLSKEESMSVRAILQNGELFSSNSKIAVCRICNIQMSRSVPTLLAHLSGKQHRAKITQWLSQQFVNGKPQSLHSSEHRCETCSMATTTSYQDLLHHLTSRRHQTNVVKSFCPDFDPTTPTHSKDVINQSNHTSQQNNGRQHVNNNQSVGDIKERQNGTLSSFLHLANPQSSRAITEDRGSVNRKGDMLNFLENRLKSKRVHKPPTGNSMRPGENEFIADSHEKDSSHECSPSNSGSGCDKSMP